MSKSIIALCCFSSAIFSMAQTKPIPKEYFEWVRKADSLYNKGDFKKSAFYYTAAFRSDGWQGRSEDRYNAACSWALADQADSAFFQLELLATKRNMAAYAHMRADTDLKSLHGDKRWTPLLEIVNQNKVKEEVNLNKPLVAMLDSIYLADQGHRMKLEDIEKKYGHQSKEVQDQWKLIMKNDSINILKVTSILDKYGWLGRDVIGQEGGSTLFLVIQHSNQKTQEKYLPMMREAVKNKKARPEHLALLEDRVAIGQGKKQIYGSQIHQDPKTGKYFLAPIEDEPNVNKRRAEVGLEPLEIYVQHWNMEYKVPPK